MFAIIGLDKLLTPTVWSSALFYLRFHPVPVRRVDRRVEEKDFLCSLLPGTKQIEQWVRRK